jgi:hypothetical protein
MVCRCWFVDEYFLDAINLRLFMQDESLILRRWPIDPHYVLVELGFLGSLSQFVNL